MGSFLAIPLDMGLFTCAWNDAKTVEYMGSRGRWAGSGASKHPWDWGPYAPLVWLQFPWGMASAVRGSGDFGSRRAGVGGVDRSGAEVRGVCGEDVRVDLPCDVDSLDAAAFPV